MGDRPVKYFSGSQPKIDRMAVSLPAGIGFGQLITLPTSPRAARESITGCFAYSSGVRFPREGTGLSAMPSPITRKYFIYKIISLFISAANLSR